MTHEPAPEWCPRCKCSLRTPCTCAGDCPGHGRGVVHIACDCLSRFTEADALVAGAQRAAREAKRRVVARLVEHEGMSTRQAGEHLGISAVHVSRLLRLRG